MPEGNSPFRPLSISALEQAPADPANEQIVRQLVDAFYGTACEDEILGPIFNERVKDWDSHLPRIYDFWSAVVLRTARYSGRPIEAHSGMPELKREHFGRWLGIWEATVEQVVPPESRDAYLVPARRMAESMADRLCGRGCPFQRPAL